MRRFIPRFSFASMLAGAAIVLVLSTGTAYAASQITGSKIKDNSVTGADIKNSSLTGTDIKDRSLTGADIKDSSLTAADILDGTLTGSDIKDSSLTGADIKDFSLSNADIGVLFAQIALDATVSNSSGGVAASKLSTGVYEVDFGIDVSSCAFIGTEGEASIGSASGGIVAATDRSGNPEAAFVTTRAAGGALTDLPFHLVAVC